MFPEATTIWNFKRKGELWSRPRNDVQRNYNEDIESDPQIWKEFNLPSQ